MTPCPPAATCAIRGLVRIPSGHLNIRRRRLAAPPALALLLGLGACYSGETAQADETGATTTTAPASTGPDESSSGGSDDSGGPKPAEFEPGPRVFPRLTERQYRNSVEQLLGAPLPAPPLEPDTNPYLFFNIGAASTTVSELGVQQYEEAADLLTRTVFDDAARRDALVGCVPAAPADECVAGFLSKFGRRAYRRPLSAEEHARWLGIASALADGDAWQGLRLALAGILQSPHFLYRVELGEPDPDDPTRSRYTSHEMASRLSFLLWNTGPDDLLLDAAAAGDLLSEAGLRAEAERLLDDPRARTAIQEFFAQFLDLGRLDGVDRDPVRYPLFSPTMIASMRTEVQLLVDDLIHRRDGDIRSIFSTRDTFVNSELAALYGVDAEGATAVTFVPVELPADGPRAGLLTLGAFLTMNAHETENSPTARGKYVRARVLCQDVPAPPPDIDLNLDPKEGEENMTLRQRLEQHRSNPVCAGCHAFIDPPGFLFENFDPIGAWRTVDNGQPIDASGDLDGTPLTSARDLAEILKDDARVGRCMVTQLYRHAIGRREVVSERAGLDAVNLKFDAAGNRFRDLMLTLVTSEVFRTVSAEEL
jgi:hypothetical protein